MTDDNKKFFTFIMMKPDAIYRGYVHDIVSILRQEGFVIEHITACFVKNSVIYSHYDHLIQEFGESFRAKIDEYYLDKPVIPIILSATFPDIIYRVRELVGVTDPSKADKKTIRGKYGEDSAEKADAENRCCYNLIHAADSAESFQREVRIWFPSIPNFINVQ